MLIFPYVALAALVLLLIAGGSYTWDYTNSPRFCGTSCHTMPPQNATYLNSPHANVYCTECHIGRAYFGQQFARKTEDVREIVSMTFHLYEFPIEASRTRPPRETCEKCHQPETFSDDSLRVLTHFSDDILSKPTSTYLVLKTGGGAKREGLGLGIHWHIVNKIVYYSPDPAGQNIPYVRVYNDDGTTTEYVDVETGFDPATVDESRLQEVSCITCHNRVSHNFMPPSESVDKAMAQGLIDPGIPGIHARAVAVLTGAYATRSDAMTAIDRLEQVYQGSDYFPGHGKQITTAMQTVREIYDRTIFIEQKVDWSTHPNNLGHMNSPGCFRCHDGKHLNAEQQAIRLECNLCHSVPVVAGPQDFVTKIEISRGPEPDSHRNPNWISLHNQSIDSSCSACHSMADAGGTSNTSFCSNSACHGSVFTYAGFDAPALREVLRAQLPTPVPTVEPAPVLGIPTFEANIGPLFAAKCTACHGAAATGGLNLTTYADLLKGGKDGAVVIPGDSANSLLIKVQSAQHFANLSPEELELVKQWIEAGAPER
jgi:hypothetical protein